MSSSAYSLDLPVARSTSVIFASPHSGREYTPAFLHRAVLDMRRLRSSEDAYVDELFGCAPAHGAPLLSARMPRAWVDLNRAPDELDPALIEGVPHGPVNPRIASGLGVIPRVVANGQAIYRGKLRRAEAEARIERFWFPYHACLRELLEQSVAHFGSAILIDCHSMPHEAIEHSCRRGQPRPDVVLGDRFGAAAASEVVEQVEAVLAGAGLRVARNMPFAGAYVAQHYGRPSRGQHVIQLELDRSLYMDEATLTPHSGFAALKALLADAVAGLAAIGRPAGHRAGMAAE